MLARRVMLASPLALAACMDSGAVRRDFQQLSYAYLTPLRLNVAEVEVRDQTQPASGDLGAGAPVAPVAALRQMAADRIKPGGSSGRAVLIIGAASIARVPGGVAGSMAVELDIVLADGTRAGFAEARVERSRSGGRNDAAGELYDLVRQMMDDMNVELEFQVRRSLREWLQLPQTAPAPAAVEQQDLAPPAPSRPSL